MNSKLKLILLIVFSSIISCNSNSQEIIEKIYYENGNLKRINYYQNDTLVKCKFFWKDGSIRSDIKIDEEIKTFKMYSKDGYLSGEYKTINGLKQGEGLVFDKNGNIIAKSNFLNDKEHGEQIFYNSDGSIERREYYEHGVFVKEEYE